MAVGAKRARAEAGSECLSSPVNLIFIFARATEDEAVEYLHQSDNNIYSNKRTTAGENERLCHFKLPFSSQTCFACLLSFN